METKYFDRWEFEQSILLSDVNPIEAETKFEEYLEKYPKDYSAYPYYVCVLITLGKFDEAEKVLNYVRNAYSRDHVFCSDLTKKKFLESNILFNDLKLLCYQERYDELYQLCLNNPQEIKDRNLNATDFYARKKSGNPVPYIREGNSYLFRQIIDYKESDFLHHIEKHLPDYNQASNQPNKNIFSVDFPVNEVLEEVKKHLLSDKRLFTGFYQNIYIFKYDNCGRVNNRTVDYFQVICFHNTKNFITMFPAEDCQNLPYVDLNSLVNDVKNTKVKRMSQIEKFNKKYGRN